MRMSLSGPGSSGTRGRTVRGLRRVAGAAALVVVVAAVCLLATADAVRIPAAAAGSAQTLAREGAGGITLKVGLFPWVPRPHQVEDVIAAAWKQRHPDVPLTFVFWDCYSSYPPPKLDVFVFDAIYLDDIVQHGLAQPLAEGEIDDVADLLPYSLQAARSDTGTLYGIPQYGCAKLLFYRRGDNALAAATDLDDVVRALGTGTYSGLKPPPGKGLIVDLSDPISDGCLYVEALEDSYGVYTADPPLAPNAARLDPWAVDNTRDLLRVASRKEANHVSPDQFRRAAWFGRGLGRALIDYSESLCDMGPAGQASAELKIMPFSDRGDVPLFYADLVSLSPGVGTGERRRLALELANLIASTDVMVNALGPWKDYPSPQYLFPLRRSVYDELTPRYPLYARMYELIGADAGSSTEPRPFRLGADARHWLDTMGPVVKRQVFATR